MWRAGLLLLGLGCQHGAARTDAPTKEADVAVDMSSDAASCPQVHGTNVTLRSLGNTRGPAVLVTAPPGDSRSFVVEQDGRILILDDRGIRPDPFLDISEDTGGPVHVGGTEQGLLGLAFDPQYSTNGTFYVFYTPRVLSNVIARYQVDPHDPDHALASSGVVVLSIADYADTHNGGMLEFGPDGYLYAGTGDGGKAGDPNNNGQNTHALLAKILRLDVGHPANGLQYGIPQDNPFASGTGGAPEVFMYGLRNPWRFSFDSGNLWIADVGQDKVEELDYIPAGTGAGLNLGWSAYEGTSCYKPPCDPAGKMMPQLELLHADGFCAIIGGQRYFGDCYPDLRGAFFFSDYCKNKLELATLHPDGTVTYAELATSFPTMPSSIHAGAHGELFVTTAASLSGEVYHLEVQP